MKRFYKNVAAAPREDGFGVTLDGKQLKSPAKRDLLLPNLAVAEAIAKEWNDQESEIHPASMPLMRLASTAIDRVATQRDTVIDEVANFATTDLVCYRADSPPALAARQQTVWQPLLDWAVLRYDAPLAVTAGVMPTPQAPASLRAYTAAVRGYDDFALTALHGVTAASSSLVIGLALMEGRLDAAAAFAAAQLEETFEIELWGEDAEQMQRRKFLAEDFAAIERFVALLRG